MNYNVVAFLEQRLNKDMSLFEYGSGNSTLFFARLVNRVVSLETERAWYDEFVTRVPANVKLILVEPFDGETYRRLIGEQDGKFDVVIVDGEDRTSCTIHAREHLTRGGVVIVDDSQHKSAHSGIERLLEHGFKRLDFEGLKPGSISGYRTTILYRERNCLGI
jgi:predicted O-methyltransferase YrrM